ncbi:MAG: hypothetical protein C0594_07650 [Marinilabiliales bacterium]|nr:MAG: hypothetical protein C0594_07650 [Marinilabiliales bacterium]
MFDVIDAPPIADMVITEIMYNPPESGTDSIEFIELYNNGLVPVNLLGYAFVECIDYSFPETLIQPGEYYVVAERTSAMLEFFGYNAVEWVGSLSNSGETLLLVDNYNRMVDSVDYSTGGDWPSEANGQGPSLTFCNPSLDNSNGLNWGVSLAYVDTLNGISVFADPGQSCAIPVPDSLGISMVNDGADVYANTAFSLSVQLYDTAGFPMAADANIDFSLSVNTGSGSLTGQINGTLMAGSSEIVVQDLFYNLAEADVILEISDNNSILNTGLSEPFDVLDIPEIKDIMITEIMYNSPESGTDTLEFFELYNNDTEAVDLLGYSFISGVDCSFDAITIQPGDFLVLAYDTVAVNHFYNVESYKYTGGLGNDGEALVLVDPFDRIVDSVFYDDNVDWPDADGTGYSLEFCEYSMDNSVPDGWGLAALFVDTIAGMDVFATPGQSCFVLDASELQIVSVNSGMNPVAGELFDVEIHTVDANGTISSVTSDLNVSLELVTGSGNLAGTTTGTITNGNSALTITGVQYDIEDTDVSIRIVDDNAVFVADTSDYFDVLLTAPVPEKLVIASVNGGNPVYANQPFSLSVSVADQNSNLAQVDQDTDVQLALYNGSGILSGTLAGTVLQGEASVTISGLNYDIPDTDVQIIASATALLSDTTDMFDVLENSGPQLSQGDIAFVQFRTDAPVGFAFVAVRDIVGGTEINFTDNGWTENSELTANEETITWTAPAEGVSKASVVVYDINNGASVGTVDNLALAGLSDQGDQIIAYQGDITAPVFISALSTNQWVESGTVDSENKSYLPAGLNNGYTALYFADSDNGYYQLTDFSGTPDEVLYSVNDTLNWFSANSSGTPFYNADNWSFTIDVNEVADLDILIYPNPTQGKISIYGIAEPTEVAITDLSGRIIEMKTIVGNTSIDLGQFKPGLYFITIKNNTIKYTFRVVKN